ncbi:hypothetical protein RND71_022662 [Anisodus tanguticus]|uniref:Uncharacterized protein n=1 Tax=Anisodus tanguticus TaxID=243964 RepID=A0AAE1V6B9_9SOLA|nr:hypothetical protein RND71_022662 [Anisodus tanguticus]
MDDTNELLYLLVDAINSGLCDANGSLSKQNIERVILPRINAKIRFPKTYNHYSHPSHKKLREKSVVDYENLKIVFEGVTANGNGSIALGADDTDATTYGEENRDFGMEDFSYDPNNDAFIVPNHYEPSYQPPSPHQCSPPSHSPLAYVSLHNFLRKECRSGEFPVEPIDESSSSVVPFNEEDNFEPIVQTQEQQREYANAWRASITLDMWRNVI